MLSLHTSLSLAAYNLWPLDQAFFLLLFSLTTTNTMHFYKLVSTISLLPSNSKDDGSPSRDVDLSIYNLIESLTSRALVHSFIHGLVIH